MLTLYNKSSQLIKLSKFTHFLTSSAKNFSTKTVHNDNVVARVSSLLRNFRSEKDVKRHVGVNKKLLVEERLSKLVEDGLLFELSSTAGIELAYGTIPRAGIFCGLANISGKTCMVVGQDATVKGGAVFPITVKKQLRAQEIAMKNHLPIVNLVDSGGAFLPLQSDIFPSREHGGRTFYNQAIHQAPQISVICGSCTAGAAYQPMMSDLCVIVDKIGSMFLGGPPLVKAALGEVISAEDLGGAKVHSSISGCTDITAENEEVAISIVQKYLELMKPYQPSLDFEVLKVEFDTSYLSTLDNSTTAENFVMKRILDELFPFEKPSFYKPEYGSGFHCGYGRTSSGQTIGFLVDTGEPPNPNGFTKLANFSHLCDKLRQPMLFVHNTCNKPLSEECLKASANAISTISCVSVPKICVVVGNSLWPNVYALSPPGLQPDFVLAWPSARYGHVGQDEASFHDALYGSARIWDDGLILPSKTPNILELLFSLTVNRRPPPADSPMPVLRF